MCAEAGPERPLSANTSKLEIDLAGLNILTVSTHLANDKG